MIQWQHFSRTGAKEIIVRAVSTHRRVGGRELDGFNGNVVGKLIRNEEMEPRQIFKREDKESLLTKQKEKLKVFMPSKRFNIMNGSLPLKTKDLKFDSQSAVNKFFREEFYRCNAGNIADMMHTTVKVSRKSMEPSYLRGHLLTIAGKLETFEAIDWTFREIATITYGLQCSNEVDIGVAEMMTVIINAAKYGLTEKLPLRPQDISMMLLGLQRMNHKQLRTRELLSFITSMIDSCSDNFDEQNVGNALRGLQRMSSDCVEVRCLLSSLTKKVTNCPNQFSSKAIGNALFGLQSMSSSPIEVQNLLKELTQKINDCTAEFSSQTVSDCMIGLKCMNGNSMSVRLLLRSLSDKFEISTRCLTPLQIGTALHGLREMDDDNEEVCRIISTLKNKLLRCPEVFNIHSVCLALSGMQYKNIDRTDVRDIMSNLTAKLLSCKEYLSPQDLSNILYGYNSIKSSLNETDNVAVLKILYDNVKAIVYGEDNYFLLPKLDYLKVRDLYTMHQSLSLALLDFSNIIGEKTNNYKSWERINKFLAEEITKRVKDGSTYFNRDLDAISSFEVIKLSSSLKSILEGSDVIIQEHCFFLNTLPCDILLQIPLQNGSVALTNIQVSYSTRIHPTSNEISSRNTRREYFLNKNDVPLYIITDSEIHENSEICTIKWLENIISNSKAENNSCKNLEM